MIKSIKIFLITLSIIFGIILLDTIQARILKNSPFISWKTHLEDQDSWVDKGIFIDTYYCTKESDIITVSWHFKTSKFTCPIDNKEITYDNYSKISTIKNNNFDTKTLVFFDNNLYGRSYSLIDYIGTSESIGVIDKLIDYKYVPKINGETNEEEILNAQVFDKTDNTIVILYNNEYVLFEKINY